MTAATGDSLSFGYDTLKRLNRVTAKSGSSIIMNTAYAYRDVSWNRGSAQVEFRNVRLGSDSGMLLEGKKYVYDDVGNLKEIRESTGKYNKLVEYAYDSQNQLTSEAYYKSGEAEAYITYNYTYDTAGNLLTVSQKKGNTTTLLQTYTYGDAQWHDLLTAVNGQAIPYDASGNPLSYGGWSFGWQNGRQLKMASKTSDGKTETLEYSYDADGIRTSKTYTVETFTQLPDYTVTFQADGATVKTMTVEDGYTLKDSDYPSVPEKVGYTGHWNKITAPITKNTFVYAVYYSTDPTHIVTFYFAGEDYGTLTVDDGYILQDCDYPELPTRDGYTAYWDTYTQPIRKDITVTGNWEENAIIPPQPTDPPEIMSGDASEPVEAGAEAYASGALVSTETVTHEYLTQSGKIVREVITAPTETTTLDFFYDESGRPFAFNYSIDGDTASTYYYILNLQGDVVQIIDANGVMQAEYIYSPWGEIISAEGDLAEINPLRYRGYYYDSETGFYYLQSRYYDPENHRFINADTYASTDSSDAIACNMFAYCGNNPVMLGDKDGEFADWFVRVVVGAAVGVVTGAISALVTGGSAKDVLSSAAVGFVTGGIVGATGSMKAGKIVGRAVASAINGGYTYYSARKAGASVGGAALAAGASAAISYGTASLSALAGDDLLVGTVSDLNIGLGGALTSSGVTALSTKCLPDKSGQSSGNTPARSQGGNSRILKTVLVM